MPDLPLGTLAEPIASRALPRAPWLARGSTSRLLSCGFHPLSLYGSSAAGRTRQIGHARWNLARASHEQRTSSAKTSTWLMPDLPLGTLAEPIASRALPRAPWLARGSTSRLLSCGFHPLSLYGSSAAGRTRQIGHARWNLARASHEQRTSSARAAHEQRKDKYMADA
jgi:hypothetical protein